MSSVAVFDRCPPYARGYAGAAQLLAAEFPGHGLSSQAVYRHGAARKRAALHLILEEVLLLLLPGLAVQSGSSQIYNPWYAV